MTDKAAQKEKSFVVKAILNENPCPLLNFERFEELQSVEDSNNYLNPIKNEINSENANNVDNSIFYDTNEKSFSAGDVGDTYMDQDDNSSSSDDDSPSTDDEEFTFNSEIDELRD